MNMLIRFRLVLLAAAMVPLLLLSSSAFNLNTASSHDSRLGFGKWYMPLCTLIIYPQSHPNCAVAAKVELSNGATMESSGSMSMKISGNSAPDEEYVYQTLEPVSFKSEGDSKDLGHVVWELDDSRQLTADEVTKIQGNKPGELFPATCDIYFYVKATAEAFPGEVFTSTTPVHMRATELKTFNPHVDELYSVVDPVDFQGKNGEVAFTVTGLTSVLN